MYRQLFGDTGPGTYTLDEEIFTSVFRQEFVDPRWLTYGVFECPPNSGRPHWLYVSSGLSNAWESEWPGQEEPSGLGCEFLLECPHQSPWALDFLSKMVAFQILLSEGRFPGKGPLKLWDRVPLRSPIDGQSSLLTSVFLAPALRFPERQQLPSGQFQLLEFIGVTEDEIGFARGNGSDKLLELLVSRNAAPVTDPARPSQLPEAGK
jgi:hypothetical protein